MFNLICFFQNSFIVKPNQVSNLAWTLIYKCGLIMKPYRFVDLDYCITFSQTSFQKNSANLNFHIFTTKIDGSEISLANERSLSRIPRVFPCKVHHCAKMNYHFIDACKALVIMIKSFLNRGLRVSPCPMVLAGQGHYHYY